MFIPKKSKVFDILLEQAATAEKAAKTMHSIAFDWKRLKKHYMELAELEEQGDKLVHFVSAEVERVFILPFDKEDIKELSNSLDDITDNLEQAANRLEIYGITRTSQELKDFSELLLQAAKKIFAGVLLVKERKLGSEEFSACYKDLHSLENHGDRLHRKILRGIMNPRNKKISAISALEIIKWKEIYQTLEDTLDKCEDIAVILDRLRTKYG